MEKVISLHQNKEFKTNLKNIYDKILREEIKLPYIMKNDDVMSIIDRRKDGSLFIKSLKLKKDDGDDIIIFSKKIKQVIKNFAKENDNILPIVIDTSVNDDKVATSITSCKEDDKLTFKFQEIEKIRVKSRNLRSVKSRMFEKFGLGLEDGPGISNVTTSISKDIVEFEDLTLPKKEKVEMKVVKTTNFTKLGSEASFFASKSKTGWRPKSTSSAKPLNKSLFNVKKRSKFTTIMINDMPEDMDQDELRELFSEYGRIKYVNFNTSVKRIDGIKTNIVTAFINFCLEQEAKKAFQAMKNFRIRSCVLHMKLISNKK